MATGRTIQAVISIDGGGALSVMNELNDSFSTFTQMANDVKNISFKALVDNIKNVHDALTGLIQPGADFQSSMAELSAMTGVVGEGLEDIGRRARENAKIFGGDAAKSVEAYKLILGQLSPKIAEVPEALDMMGKNVSILSKQMKNDVVAATEVLTTAMNQYQISLTDPIAASEKMAEMMNIMTAAALDGSAELPQIKEALKQVGMVAKTAGVSFSETNAAIQVLDKAGRRGSEGGISLRNIISDLDRGRMLPKIVREEFKKLGIDYDILGDHTISLTERLRSLTPVMNDAALMTKLFGESSYASGVALLSNLEEIERINDVIQGTNAAEEYAATAMDTYNEAILRMQAHFDDLKISIFNVTGGFMPFVEIIGSSAVQVSLLLPLLSLMGKTFKAYIWPNVVKAALAVGTWTKAVIWNKGILASWSALQAIHITMTNLLTGSITAATAAQRIFTAAFVTSPLGWIAAAIGVIAGAYLLLKNNASEAAEETAKTLQNLKDTAGVRMTEKKEEVLAQKKTRKDILKAELEAAKTPEQKHAVYKKIAEESTIPFDSKKYDTNPLLYDKQYDNVWDKLIEANTERAGLEEAIGELRKGIAAIPNVQEQQKRMEETDAKEGIFKLSDKDGASYFKRNKGGELEQITEEERDRKFRWNKTYGDYFLKKDSESFLKGFVDALTSVIEKENVLKNPTTTPIIPSPSTDTKKQSDTIKGGEGIKNINITINDGLVKSVTNIFNHAEANLDDFMEKLKTALMLVLNDANTI